MTTMFYKDHTLENRLEIELVMVRKCEIEIELKCECGARAHKID
jgi:hypothetical protein